MSLCIALNSYCTVVEREEGIAPVLESCDEASKLRATPVVVFAFAEPGPRTNTESFTTQRGAFQLGAAAFTVSHWRRRPRASSGKSAKRTPARPSASAQAT